MNRPESRPQVPSSPASSRPQARPRKRRREERADLEHCLFKVVWPLPQTLLFPTLARRSIALVLDVLFGLPFLPLAVTLTEAAAGFSLLKYDAAVRYAMTAILMYAVYFSFWESSPARATPGKILLDLRVATASDKPLRFADAMIRFWLRVATVLSLNAGFWLAWRNPRGQALHDRWCRTVVVAHHVTPGRLRSAVRPPRPGDLVAALVASALAYALVFQLAPALLRELRLADRFDAAIVEVTPALIAGDLVGRDGQWSRRLREASDVVGELELAMDVDRDNRVLVLRAPVALMAADSGQQVLDPPSVRLERKGVTAETGTWSCTGLGLAFYAQPSRCRDIPRSPSGLTLSPEAMAFIP